MSQFTDAPFDFSCIREKAQELVKTYGRKTHCKLLRAIEATPNDSTQPWRVGAAASVLTWSFTGVVSPLPFPKRSDPIVDKTDIGVIMPGDFITYLDDGTKAVTPGEPTLDDRIQVTDNTGTLQYAILGIAKIQADDLPIVFNLRCRAWPLITRQPSTPY